MAGPMVNLKNVDSVLDESRFDMDACIRENRSETYCKAKKLYEDYQPKDEAGQAEKAYLKTNLEIEQIML